MDVPREQQPVFPVSVPPATTEAQPLRRTLVARPQPETVASSDDTAARVNTVAKHLSVLTRAHTAPRESPPIADQDPPVDLPNVEPIEPEELAGLLEPTAADIERGLECLPHADALPAAADLETLRAESQGLPIEITKPVTLGDMRTHLEGSTLNTPEVALEIIDDRYILRVGVAKEVPGLPDWEPYRETAQAFGHTHPSGLPIGRTPSLRDLEDAARHFAPSFLANSQGITLYSPRTASPADAWDTYCLERQGHYTSLLERDASLSVDGVNQLAWMDFAERFGRCQYLSWDELPPETTLQEAIHHMQNASSAGKKAA